MFLQILHQRFFAFLRVLFLQLTARRGNNVATAAVDATTCSTRPNIVILFADNLAQEDVGAFRTTHLDEPSHTPRLDAYIGTSKSFANWNSPAVLCSASRAALLTGRYPIRTGIYPRTFAPDAELGLLPTEQTLAEFLLPLNYSTKMVGKWHLGQRPEYLPTAQGFQEWFGIPYHMSGGSVEEGVCGKDVNKTMWLPLYHNNQIVEQPVILEQLAPRYVQESIQFIQENAAAQKPFFLYLPFSHVHQLCAPRVHECQWASTHFSRDHQTWNATFANAVQEMDWIAGQVLDALQTNGIENNTLVLFTSDNGPWVAEQSCAGRKGIYTGQWLQDNVPQDCTACPSEYVPAPLPNQPRRCIYPHSDYEVEGIPCGEDTGLGSAFEANVRMPAFARWPGHIEPGTTTWDMITTLDVVPTILGLLGQPIPDNIDGMDASSILLGPSTTKDEASSHNRTVFFWRDGFPEGPLPQPFGRFDVVAIKMDRYKLFYSTKSSHYNEDLPQYHNPPLIFDILADPAESQPLDPALYSDLIQKANQAVEDHKKSVDWENTSPLCLPKDPKYLPCADRSNQCRTHPPPNGEVVEMK